MFCLQHYTQYMLYCQVMKSFGENLKYERKIAGLTQQQLADKMGIKQQQLSRWERDEIEPAVSSIVAIAKALDVSFDDLFDGIE